MELDHEKLDVYRVALDFAVWAYALCRTLKGMDRPTRDQLIRASQSIALNIAEGCGKIPSADRGRFPQIASGSARECGAVLDILNRCGTLDGQDRVVTITVERGDGGPVIRAIRLGRPGAEAVRSPGSPSVGLKPLREMTADDRYKGEDGGLYGGGRNEPPEAHQAAVKKQTARIVPLDADGRPSQDGKIGLVSISMSNATREYSLFKQIADRDPRKSPSVAIVDCAQGGQAMAEWADPNARAWTEADRRLQQAQVSVKQVQVAWVKLANKGPRGDLGEHGKKLQSDTMAVLRNARARFPNLRIAYLGSRIYGGYAATPLNPEPYAYEGAFVVRWQRRMWQKN